MASVSRNLPSVSVRAQILSFCVFTTWEAYYYFTTQCDSESLIYFALKARKGLPRRCLIIFMILTITVRFCVLCLHASTPAGGNSSSDNFTSSPLQAQQAKSLNAFSTTSNQVMIFSQILLGCRFQSMALTLLAFKYGVTFLQFSGPVPTWRVEWSVFNGSDSGRYYMHVKLYTLFAQAVQRSEV